MSVLSSGNVVTSWMVGYVNRATADVEKIQKRLLNGEREYDSVRVGMANQLDVQAATSSKSVQNLNDGISYLNVADSALASVQEMLVDVQSLIEDASFSTDPTERDTLNQQANALIAQSNDIISSAKFGDRFIFSGELNKITLGQGGAGGSFEVVVGDGSSITTGAIDITSLGDPAGALAQINEALDNIEVRKGGIQAGRSRATVATTYLGVMMGLYSEAAVITRDFDEVSEITALEEATARQSEATNLLLSQLSSKQDLAYQIYASIRGG